MGPKLKAGGIVCLALYAFLPLTGCAVNASGNGSNVSVLSGNWQITLVRSQTNAVKIQTGFLLQQGTTLTGEVLLTQTGCAGVGTVSGQVSGQSVSIMASQTGQTVNFTGTAATDGSTMQGDYSLLASGCGNTQTGTWTATRIPPLNGNFQGTLTSTKTPGVVFHFDGKVAQEANTGHSTATLTGDMTSPDAPSCFNSVNITGLVSGTDVVFNFAASDGTSLGASFGTGTTDMTTITGQYNFFNGQSNILASCGGGDFGDAVLTVQTASAI